ncbi:DUF4345 family protein [Gracilimonas sp.]|uniref:DUF4345 family protein n=1 Tax=Gracilimonas sp. TaxID=1974203 RepID=UPI002871954D|nr:DUF4345 family protein [Gracilimonas sp.]
MHKKSALFLRVSALILMAYALSFIVYPQLLGELVGFTHMNPNTLVEVTAFYGGLELGIAIFLLWSAAREERLYFALMMVFFVFMAAGLARLFGVIRFGFEGPSQPVVTVLEIGWGFLSYWLAGKIHSD